MEDKKSILDYFAAIPDRRRGAGQRHEQTLVLVLVLMSTMSGYTGYRAIGDFVQRNRAALLEHLQPKKGRLPSFDTIRRILQGIDFAQVNEQFNRWAAQSSPADDSRWISIDGKTIAGTVAHANDSQQQFTSLVSLYCAGRQLVLGIQQIKHSKDNEITIVQELLKALDLQGVRFTMDALHCQKKQPPSSSPRKVTMLLV